MTYSTQINQGRVPCDKKEKRPLKTWLKENSEEDQLMEFYEANEQNQQKDLEINTQLLKKILHFRTPVEIEKKVQLINQLKLFCFDFERCLSSDEKYAPGIVIPENNPYFVKTILKGLKLIHESLFVSYVQFKKQDIEDGFYYVFQILGDHPFSKEQSYYLVIEPQMQKACLATQGQPGIEDLWFQNLMPLDSLKKTLRIIQNNNYKKTNSQKWKVFFFPGWFLLQILYTFINRISFQKTH